MTTTLPTRLPLPTSNPGSGIDPELFLDCIHCGLCLSACPTYEILGTEGDSPRGRIYLMRAVSEGRLPYNETVRDHLDLCLNCRACETACPSGVQYHKLLEPFREAAAMILPSPPLPWFQRWALRSIFPYRGRTRLALMPVRVLQWSGLDGLLERIGFYSLLPKSLRSMRDLLPPLRRHYGRLPEVLPPIGPKRAKVGLFLGCVADGVYPRTQLATARVLQHNGCEVHVVPGQVCCGALSYHAHEGGVARRFAAENLRAFETTSDEPFDAVVTNAAGCGAMLKEYGELFRGEAAEAASERFAGRVKDVCEFLMELGPVPPTHAIRLRVTYHDACHLRHAQRIETAPRKLLSMIPGLELVPLPESELCCGAAGSYNLTQPEMADQLGRRKAEHILATGAEMVLTGNVGCLMQVSRHLRRRRPGFRTAHPADLIRAAYEGGEIG